MKTDSLNTRAVFVLSLFCLTVLLVNPLMGKTSNQEKLLSYSKSTLVYSTFLGGSVNETGNAIAVDNQGNCYVTGYTMSPDFPITSGAYDTAFRACFVTKLNPSGSQLIYSTFLGGGTSGSSSPTNNGYSIAVDSEGNAYVAGYTASTDFPITSLSQPTSYASGNYFVTKLNPTGSILVYSTLIGRTNAGGRNIFMALDNEGNTYCAGMTNVSSFPVTPGAWDTTFNGTYDCFVSKLNAAGSNLVYSTFLGGSGNNVTKSIAVDSAGNAYVTGYTQSTDFPVTPGVFQNTFAGSTDSNGYVLPKVFVTKLNPYGTGLVYSTILGGRYDNYCYGIAVDNLGNAYITGRTDSYNFPSTPAAYDTVFRTGDCSFITKLNPTASQIIYSTALKSNNVSASVITLAITLDKEYNAYVTGWTSAQDFPVTPGAFDTTSNGINCFVSKFNALGTNLLYSTYLGGNRIDTPYAIALDSSENIYITGVTSSADFPVTPGAFETTPKSGNTVFVTKLSPQSSLAPVADFMSIPASGYVSLTVQFYDKSFENPTSWNWDFGDGGSDTTQNPVHIYNIAGNYSVRLIVSNNSGTATSIKLSYIQAAPQPYIDMNPTHVQAISSYGGIKFYWDNPLRLDYGATLITYRTDRYPAGPGDGNLVYWFNGTQCNVPGVNGQKYYFAIYAHDTLMNFGPGLYVAAIPNSYLNPDQVLLGLYGASPTSCLLRWRNPDALGYTGYTATILLRRSDRYPLDPADGYDPSDGSWFRYWYNGTAHVESNLTLNSTYNYILYAHDTNMNFSSGIGGTFISGYHGIPNVNGYGYYLKYNSLAIDLSNPTAANFAGTIVARRTDRYPTNPTDGTIEYWGNETHINIGDMDLGQKYYYGIYCFDTLLNFSPGYVFAELSGSLGNIQNLIAIPGDGYVSLSWNPSFDPVTSAKYFIVRRTDRMPVNPLDGTMVYWNSSTSYQDTSVVNGQTYYYGIFVTNGNQNLSQGMGIGSKPFGTSKSILLATDDLATLIPSLPQPIANNYSGWNDLMGDFSNQNAVQFWASDKESYWQDSTYIINGDNTKLTLKNLINGGNYKVKITYEAANDIKVQPVFLVNKEGVDNEIIQVLTPINIITQEMNGLRVTEADLYGDAANSEQLQFVLDNPPQSEIRIHSVQIQSIAPLKVVSIHNRLDRYAELMQ